MKLFSQRKGIEPVKSVLQVDYIDADLRNGLWNASTLSYWDQIENKLTFDYGTLDILVKRLWHSYFKQPIDTLGDCWDNIVKHSTFRTFECVAQIY